MSLTPTFTHHSLLKNIMLQSRTLPLLRKGLPRISKASLSNRTHSKSITTSTPLSKPKISETPSVSNESLFSESPLIKSANSPLKYTSKDKFKENGDQKGYARTLNNYSLEIRLPDILKAQFGTNSISL